MGRVKMIESADYGISYFNHLCEEAGVETYVPGQTYRLVAHTLYNRDFYSAVPGDDNRIEDALALRQEFRDIAGLPSSELDFPPSCLEVLLALAKRIENDIMGDESEIDRTQEWFFMILTNLGLDKYWDEAYSFAADYEMKEILEHFLDRKYGKDGKYCAFPCEIRSKKLEDVELWFQMQHYLDQKVL